MFIRLSINWIGMLFIPLQQPIIKQLIFNILYNKIKEGRYIFKRLCFTTLLNNCNDIIESINPPKKEYPVNKMVILYVKSKFNII